MATFDDVRRLALALPETSESTSYGNPSINVRTKSFVWERPFRKTDLAQLSEAGLGVPKGTIIGLSVADETVKTELIAADPDVYFTIPHFDGYAAVLVRLNAIDVDELEEALTDAWLARAPKTLARTFLDEQD